MQYGSLAFGPVVLGTLAQMMPWHSVERTFKCQHKCAAGCTLLLNAWSKKAASPQEDKHHKPDKPP